MRRQKVQAARDQGAQGRFPLFTAAMVMDSMAGPPPVGGSGRQASGPSDPHTSLMLRDVPATVHTRDLIQLFEKLNIKDVDYLFMPRENSAGKGRVGYAFVNFTSHEAAGNAVPSLHGYTEPSFPRPLSVRTASYQGVAANLAQFHSVRPGVCEDRSEESWPFILLGGELKRVAPLEAARTLNLLQEVADRIEEQTGERLTLE